MLLLGTTLLEAGVEEADLEARRQPRGDGSLPAPLGRLHPQYQTPQVAFVAMGVIASALLVGNALLGRSSQNVFWMIFKLSSLCFLFSYLFAFPAFVKLRRSRPQQPRPYRMPGGEGVALAASGVCWLFILGACVLFFRPSPDAAPAQALRESLLLGGECLATLVVGLLLMPRRGSSVGHRSTSASHDSG